MGDSKVVWLCLILSAISCFHYACALRYDKQSFTSIANLLKLYYMEEESLSNVDIFLREEMLEHGDKESADAAHNLTAVRKLVEEAKQIHRKVGPKIKEYLYHPVNAFHLTHRLHGLWKDAIDLIRNSKACREWDIPDIVERLENIEDNLPTHDDCISVAYNLLTIQHTQGLRTKDIVEGRLGDHLPYSPISPQEQFEIAKLAVEEDDYYYAAQWLKHLSKDKGLKDMRKDVDGFNATNVLGMLASAYFRINMIPEALKTTNELLRKDPGNMLHRTNKVFFEQRMERDKDKQVKKGYPIRFGKEDQFRQGYETLCRGKSLKPSRLKCRLEPAWPGSRISFYKMEVLRRKPPIVAFHDIISRRDAVAIVNVSETEYENTAVSTEDGFDTPQFTLVLSRVAAQRRRRSQKAFAEQKQQLEKIRGKLQRLPHTVTPPYVSGESEARNYGLQGFYVNPGKNYEILNMGGHTGTGLIFLNNVEMGGEIVFPKTNTRVSPQIGTVVFYYPTFRKFHAVCPVAYGTQWMLFHSFYEKVSQTKCRDHEDPDLAK